MQGPDWTDASGEDREVPEGQDSREVSDQPVNDEPTDPAMTSLSGDEVPKHSVVDGAGGVHHHDVARLGKIETLVDHQVVSREHLDRAGGPQYTGPGGRQSVDLPMQGEQPVHQI